MNIMNNQLIKSESIFIEPKIAYCSCVAIHFKSFPIGFGNYFSFNHKGNSVYCVNMWYENLEEIIQQKKLINLQIQLFTSKFDFAFCFVVDSRISKDWLNNEICTTGCGGKSRAMTEALYDFAGLQTLNHICGCEMPEQFVELIETHNSTNCISYRCCKCHKEWNKT